MNETMLSLNGNIMIGFVIGEVVLLLAPGRSS